jgi:hypothetical protein
MATYEELQNLKKKIEQKHATSEHTKQADIVILTAYEKIYQEIEHSLGDVLKKWKPQVTFCHAKNACDAFWTKKGVSVFITDYFVHADFSILGPQNIGDYVAKLYKEEENAIVAVVSPYFNDYSGSAPDYRMQRYFEYWQREYYRWGWTRPGVGSPQTVSMNLERAGFKAFGADEKGMDSLRKYVHSEIDNMVTSRTT